MKTTQAIVDEEHEYLREMGYIKVEQYEMGSRLMRELWEKDKVAKVILGKVRKMTKKEKNATVSRRKAPRIISLQFNNRRVLASPFSWD